MITLVVLLILSIILLWLLVMYSLWKQKNKHQEIGSISEIVPQYYSKSSRFLRRLWFGILRLVSKLGDTITIFATKVFFGIFPKAKRAFEKKDELTGLEQGPSSYFLMSITEEVAANKVAKKTRRKSKNV
jgi:preprotein translocase subunit YajC